MYFIDIVEIPAVLQECGNGITTLMKILQFYRILDTSVISGQVKLGEVLREYKKATFLRSKSFELAERLLTYRFNIYG
ncbi:hypothetical protein [Paenibacillus dendritiformis]|uniref:hypothetical protein n=1 Tax=Paenibacillus dendritiformis TaxID=130049 RepID=UPI00387E0C78